MTLLCCELLLKFMKYENYENAIIERLKLQGVDISALPHVDVLNEARHTTKPQIFVIFNGAEYNEPEELGGISQVENLKFEIFIRSRKRRGTLGVLELYEYVCRRLLGWHVPNSRTPVIFDSFGYVAGLQNNWQYALVFSFTGYIVESDNLEETPTAPLIKKITNNLTSKM